MNQPNYTLMLSGIPAMREVAAIRTRAARDEAMKQARTPEDRAKAQALYYDQVRQNRSWFDDQEQFLRACIEYEKGHAEGREIVIPKRSKKATKNIIGAREYDDLMSPLELIATMTAQGLPPEVQAIMLLVEGLLECEPGPQRDLIFGQIQMLVLDLHHRAQQVGGGRGSLRLGLLRR